MRAVTKLLKRSRQRLIDRGWIQGEMGSSRRGYCLIGALAADEFAKHETYTEATSIVSKVLQARTGENSIVTFNDFRAENKGEVIEVLDEAIAKASR